MIQHVCDAATVMVPVADIPCCTSLYHLELVYVVLLVGVPCRTGVLQGGSEATVIILILSIYIAHNIYSIQRRSVYTQRNLPMVTYTIVYYYMYTPGSVVKWWKRSPGFWLYLKSPMCGIHSSESTDSTPRSAQDPEPLGENSLGST